MEVTKTLYGLSQEIIFKLMTIDENNPELISQLENELMVKVDNVASFMEYLEDQIELAKAKERKLKDMRNALEAKLAWLEAYCVKTLDHAQKTSVIGNNKEIKLRTNPMSIEVLEPENVPTEFVDLKQELVINKKKILKHVKATGEEVKGTIAKRNKSIWIKEVLK